MGAAALVPTGKGEETQRDALSQRTSSADITELARCESVGRIDMVHVRVCA